MENMQNQEILNKYMDEIFSILNSDNELNFVCATPSIKNMVFTLYENILKQKKVSKINKFISTIFQENFRKQLYETNTSILECETSSFRYLVINFQFLDDFDKEILNHYFNILKYMLQIDFLRNEWLLQNSNEGRTIFSNHKITEMQNYYDKVKTEYEQIADLEDTKDKIKGLNINAK